MKKDKALLFLPYLAPYRINALNEIGKYYDLTVVFLLENTVDIKYDQKELRSKLNVDFVVLTSGFNFKKRQIRYGIFKLIRKYRPTVIFSNEYGLTSLLISLYKYLKVFRYKHISTTSDNVTMADSTYLVRRLARTFVINSCEGMIVYNKETKDWYQKRYKNTKVKICPNIQDPEDLLPYNDIFQKLSVAYKHQYNLVGKKIYLFVGRFQPMKGLSQLITNFNQVREENEVLILVGDGPLRADIERQIKYLGLEGVILLPGKFEGERLFAWYKLADLFILASSHEPFGAVINESLILGTPVLCSSVAGATYFVKEGINGLVFNPWDSNDFIEKFKRARTMFVNSGTKERNLMLIDFKDSLRVYKIVCS